MNAFLHCEWQRRIVGNSNVADVKAESGSETKTETEIETVAEGEAF